MKLVIFHTLDGRNPANQLIGSLPDCLRRVFYIQTVVFTPDFWTINSITWKNGGFRILCPKHIGSTEARKHGILHTQMLHVWNIYLHLGQIYRKCIDKYTIHGSYWTYFGPTTNSTTSRANPSDTLGQTVGEDSVPLHFWRTSHRPRGHPVEGLNSKWLPVQKSTWMSRWKLGSMVSKWDFTYL